MTLKNKDKKLLWHLKSKIKKLFGQTCILDNFITRKFELHGVFLWIKDPDPDPQHWFLGHNKYYDYSMFVPSCLLG